MCLLEAAASSPRRFSVLMAAIAVAFIALGLGLGLALSASGVLASHDDPDVIHACVNPLSRIARIVENPARCARYEELVEWQGAGGTAGLEARISALEQENTTQQETIDALETENATQQTAIDGLVTQVEDLAAWQAALACLQTAAGLNPEVDDIVFTACNVHVRDGSGDTDGAVNGLGNLIVGYNEDHGTARTGSHNLVVGPFHTYTSYGGSVAGGNNTISGAYSSVSGGAVNTASGFFSSVSGGSDNTASGRFSSVSGGTQGEASGYYDTVIGDTDGAPAFDATTGTLLYDDNFLP